MHEYGLPLLTELPTTGSYQAVVMVVAHDHYRNMGIEALRALGVNDAVVYDIKSISDKNTVDGRL